MHPLVLSHEVVSFFSFWHNGVAHQGISTGKELYGFHARFSAADREKAFNVATDLAETGAEVCITCLPTEYQVWVSLRNLEQVSLCFLPDMQSEEAMIA
jgi:hypothetical protein